MIRCKLYFGNRELKRGGGVVTPLFLLQVKIIRRLLRMALDNLYKKLPKEQREIVQYGVFVDFLMLGLNLEHPRVDYEAVKVYEGIVGGKFDDVSSLILTKKTNGQPDSLFVFYKLDKFVDVYQVDYITFRRGKVKDIETWQFTEGESRYFTMSVPKLEQDYEGRDLGLDDLNYKRNNSLMKRLVSGFCDMVKFDFYHDFDKRLELKASLLYYKDFMF